MGLRWLAIGDSITRGTGATVLSKGYLYQTRKLLKANGKPCSLINTGIVGIRSDEMLAKYKGYGGRCDPDLVTIMAGTNDITQSVNVSTYTTNLSNLIDDIRSQKVVGQCQIVLCTIIFRTDASYSQNAAFNQAINDVAASKGVQVVDTASAFSSATYMTDTWHPNDAGHLLLANVLHPALSSLSVWGNVPHR